MRKIWYSSFGTAAFRIAAIYFVVSALWIVFSDETLSRVVHNPRLITHISIYKGWAFVFLSALLIYFLVRKGIQESEKANLLTVDIIDSMTECFFSLDYNLVVQHYNKAAEIVLGIPKGEVIGKKLFDAFGVIKDTDFGLKILKALQEKQPSSFETYVQSWDKWCDIHIWPHPNGISVYLMDISERKRIEDKLRKSESKFAKAFQYGPQIVAISSFDDGVYLDVNDSFIDRLKYSRDEAIGRSSLDLGIWTYPAQRENAIALINDHCPLRNHEVTFTAKDGSIIDCLCSFDIIEIEDRKCLLSISNDITDRKKAEEALKVLNTELEQRVQSRTNELQTALHELETFSYSVSHDLSTPLRAIAGFAALIKQDIGHTLDAENADYLNRIIRAAERMSELINDLLALSRVTEYEMNLQTVDFSTLTDTILNNLSSASDRDVVCYIERGITATGDIQLLRLLMENLLGNAWKFTSHTEDPIIEFFTFQENGQTVYCIKDNGAGFEQQYADRLFLPFQRLHTSDEFEGNGIGLATVARVIKRHGGTIWAEGKINAGASFYFTLSQ
jgi:PAS domain S-box-containing protein